MTALDFPSDAGEWALVILLVVLAAFVVGEFSKRSDW